MKSSKSTTSTKKNQNGHTDAEIRKMIRWLASDYFHPEDRTQDTYTRLAEALSKIADKDPPWTWRYPHQLEAGNMPIPKRVRSAICKLYQRRVHPRKPYPPHIRITYQDPDQCARHAALTMAQRRRALDLYMKGKHKT
jgi:hypothetical protein